MTREEKLNRIDTLETARFYLAMKDRWTRADFDRDDKMWNEIFTLKKELKLI